MSDRAETLLTQGDRLFDQVQPLRSMQQMLAENFYVERADFTASKNLGADYAAHLTTSYPLKVRRDLANIFSTMLRPQEKPWATMTTRNYDSLDEEAKRWLEMGTGLLRNAFYDPDSGFARATSQADDDIAVFGQAVVSCEMNWRKRALLFRNWHLRDCVWAEDSDGNVGRFDRKWTPGAMALNSLFKGNISPKLKECLAKEPYKEVQVRHIFVPIEEYDNGKKYPKGTKYVSIFYDVENKFIMEEVPYRFHHYAVPRWKTIAGSQYAYSPSATAALPNARLMQDVMLSLLEAGQNAVTPPMLAYEDALRSDANLFAGGITVVDSDYDERTGVPLRPVFDSRNTNIPIGVDMMRNIQQEMTELFYLNKIGLPEMGSGMSQMEVSQRVSEYVRGALPLFEPLEAEYNSRICGIGFEVAFANGFFGPNDSIPEQLLGNNIEFKFTNPLREASDRIKGSMLMESASVLQNMAAFDPSAPSILDAKTAARDVIEGIGAPRKWFRTPEEVQEMTEAANEKQSLLETIGVAQAGGAAAEQIATAGQAMQGLQQ